MRETLLPMLYDDTYAGERYRYALRLRPLTTSHVPRGWIVGSDRPHEAYPCGTVDFPRQLTTAEIEGYELVPVPVAPDLQCERRDCTQIARVLRSWGAYCRLHGGG